LPDVKMYLIEQRRYLEVMQIPRDYIVDGYRDFVFLTKNGKPYTNGAINNFLKSIIRDCNTWEKKRAIAENRMPVLLPHFSVHILRHTFCSRLCSVLHDYKAIQEIMGHSDIRITMNVYNHFTQRDFESTMEELKEKLKIG